MTRDEILQAFDRMRVWQRGDQRAVHKPLLVIELGPYDYNIAISDGSAAGRLGSLSQTHRTPRYIGDQLNPESGVR